MQNFSIPQTPAKRQISQNRMESSNGHIQEKTQSTLPKIRIQDLDLAENVTVQKTKMCNTNVDKKVNKSTIEMFTDFNKKKQFTNLSRATLDGFSPHSSIGSKKVINQQVKSPSKLPMINSNYLNLVQDANNTPTFNIQGV